MKSVFRFFGIVVVVAVIGVSMTGCMHTPDPDRRYWDTWRVLTEANKYMRDYTILGVIQVERTRIGIIGFHLPILNNILAGLPVVDLVLEGFLWEWGGVRYADLIAEAQRRFPNANAVINMQIDRSETSFIIAVSRRYTVTALAVEFAAEPRR